MRRPLLLALTALFCVTLSTALAVGWGWRQLNAPLTLPAEGLLFEVERGSPLAAVTSDLEVLGVLQYPRILDFVRTPARYCDGYSCR